MADDIDGNAEGPRLPEPARGGRWPDALATAVHSTPWPASALRFREGLERARGLTDRLQIECLRRSADDGRLPRDGGLGSDVASGEAWAAEIARANQPVLPMLALTAFGIRARSTLEARLHVAGEERPLVTPEIEATLGGKRVRVALDARGTLLRIDAPAVRGTHQLELVLRAEGEIVGANRYPLHVVAVAPPAGTFRLLGGGPTADALARLEVTTAADGVAVVAEDALDDDVAATVAGALADGETVVLLAQGQASARHCPVPVEIVEHASGHSPAAPICFTADEGAAPSLPRRRVLAHEVLTIGPTAVVSRIDGGPWPHRTVVGAVEAGPGEETGTVLGDHRVGRGRLILCQFRLAVAAAAGDATALAVLGDVLGWAVADDRAPLREAERKDDGRAITYFTFPDRPADARGGRR